MAAGCECYMARQLSLIGWQQAAPYTALYCTPYRTALLATYGC